jgi:hypothetical protein
MIDYEFSVLQILGYCLLIFSTWFYLRKRFNLLSLIILILITVFAFEVVWEMPVNFYSLYVNGILAWDTFAKHIFMMYPMYLWLLYSWLYGTRKYLLLFLVAIFFELIVVSNYSLSYNLSLFRLSWLVRYLWIVIFILNIRSWNHTSPIEC